MFRDFGDDDDKKILRERSPTGKKGKSDKEKDEEKTPFRPQILMLSSGETTPFSVTFGLFVDARNCLQGCFGWGEPMTT